MYPDIDIEFHGETRSALLFEADIADAQYSIYAVETDDSVHTIHFLMQKQEQGIIIIMGKPTFSSMASSLGSELDDPHYPGDLIQVISMFIEANAQTWVSEYDRLVGKLFGDAR